MQAPAMGLVAQQRFQITRQRQLPQRSTQQFGLARQGGIVVIEIQHPRDHVGLVYTVEITAENDVNVVMTLTAPGCPVAGEMPGWVSDAVDMVAGVRAVQVAMTFDPPWGMEMMSDEARLELGFM